ncbi:MAG TPA: 50S ribosomal protein L11 methyltransferase [Bacteroidales bacterium]|nr:50S ribosomal protein L11 methyltransferase [Bacteroidales bacterium]
MNYLELNCEIFPPRHTEIVMAAFSDYGFESFEETVRGFRAYIPEHQFDEKTFNTLEIFDHKEIKINYALKSIPDQNWNAVWESNFEPVEIGNRCYIRAPFHPSREGFEYEIIIEPKMSFGTGHHETTHQMVSLLLEQDVRGKEVLDMGCGTAVLAILAKKTGAAAVLAIDNEEWAYNNSLENIEKNNTPEIEVLHGDAAAIGSRLFDLILANINRNVLLKDIPTYAAALKQHGTILLSGFYETDVSQITKKAAQYNLKFIRYTTMNSWCAAVYTKD